MAAATITYLQNAGAVDVNTTHTFSTQNLGTAATDRYIICCFSGRAASVTPVLTSITIGGVTATIIKQANDAIGLDIASIVIALVPTGTTGDVVIVTTQTMGSWDIALYTTSGLGALVATATGSSTANPLTANLNVNAGGVAVACATSDSGVATATWAGLTEQYDDATAGGNDKSGASGAFATLQTALTISCTWTSSVRPVYVSASFPPAAPSSVMYKSTQTSAFATGSTIVITTPVSLYPGDIMIASIFAGINYVSITPPTGWTSLGFTTNPAEASAVFYYYKIATTTDVAATNYTWTYGASCRHAGSITRVSGGSANVSKWVWGGDDKTALNTNAPAVSTNTTPTAANSLMLAFWFASTATTGISNYAVVTSNPVWTEAYDMADTTTYDMSMAYAIRPEITNTGNGSCSGGGATTDWCAGMITIPPINTANFANSRSISGGAAYSSPMFY